MNALFLSGESLHNKIWIEQVVADLSPLFDKTVVHHYRHWAQGGPIDFNYELPMVIEEVKKLEPYIIFAKSAGAVLSMQGIARGALNPKYCFFTGVPLPLAKRTDNALAAWGRNYHGPSLFIQNEHDPLTGSEELKSYLESLDLTNYELVSLPGDSHNYPDIAKLHQLVANHLH
jgi:pimeloyl-ACP methyl ester carboxylesterase